MAGFDGVGELIDCWWDLQSLHQNSLLSLDENVFWPSNESGEITLVLDVVADTVVSWSAFEQWVSLNGSGFLGFRSLLFSTFGL